MSDFLVYLLAGLALTGVGAFWYFTRSTELGRKALPYLVIAVVVVIVAVSCKNKIPFLGSIASWIRDKFADSKIKELEGKIDTLKEQRDQGTTKAGELESKAEGLLAQAEKLSGTVKSLDTIIAKKKDMMAGYPKPDVVAEAALPAKTGDPAQDAENLLVALKKRNK